jgi:F0F1-type ATP synthase assembly protein I
LAGVRQQSQESSNSSGKQPNAILRYTGLATQMMVIVVACALAGIWLDGHFTTEIPWFTGVLTVFGVVASMYTAVKDLLRS